MHKFYRSKSESKNEKFPVKLNNLHKACTSKKAFLDSCQNDAWKNIQDDDLKTFYQIAQSGNFFIFHSFRMTIQKTILIF